MTEDLPQKTVGVDDEEALHRAVIEELYEKNKQKEEDRDSTVEKDAYDYKSSVVKYFLILHNPRKFGSKVTGIETRPALPNSIDNASDLNNHDIDSIRFEIGSYKTKWYDWVGRDLENIVDYYADGDISEFISDTKVNLAVKSGSQAQINIPDNLNSRKDRLKEKLESRKYVLSQEGFNIIDSRPEIEKRAYAIFYTFLIVWLILNLAINRGGAFFASMTLILFLFVYLMIGSLWQVKSDNKYDTYDPIRHLKPIYEPIYKTLKILYQRIDKID